MNRICWLVNLMFALQACSFDLVPDTSPFRGEDGGGGAQDAGRPDIVLIAEDDPGAVEDVTDVVETGSESEFTVSVCGAAERLSPPVPVSAYRAGLVGYRFLSAGGTHLGDDIFLAEGTSVYAIASGRIIYYGPATRYGEVLAVVEHDFGRPVPFRNGLGDVVYTRYVISIYGHLRASEARGGTPTGLGPGACVDEGTVIGFINDREHNGGSSPHLHFGLRLMSAAEAWARDGRYAFRGYDLADHRFRGDYADPSRVFFGDGMPESEEPEVGGDPEDMRPDCEGYQRCGMSACERIVPKCLDGVPQECVPAPSAPELCGDWVDNDCNGRIDDCEDVEDVPPPPDDPPDDPPPCGFTVEAIWNTGVNGWTFYSDLYSDWRWGMETGSSAFRQTFFCVSAGTHRLNAEFPGRIWGCGEWPEDRLNTPYGRPEILINGRPAAVAAREEDGLSLGCNFFVTVE